MVESTITLRRATAEDRDQITCVLQEVGIVAEGLEQWVESFILAEAASQAGTEIVATAGFEKYGKHGLLRSLVIRKKAWNIEDGVKLLELIFVHARSSGVGMVYLLTESPTLFIHMGFELLDKGEIPEELLASKHFVRNIKRAVPMRKVLV